MSKIEKKVLKNRTEYFLNGNFHREDGPAIEYASGTKKWFRNGQRHREDGPAIEWFDGTKIWYQNGNLHREDGPAVEWSDEGNEWYLNGKEVDFWTVWNLDDDKERKKKLCFYLDEISK